MRIFLTLVLAAIVAVGLLFTLTPSISSMNMNMAMATMIGGQMTTGTETGEGEPPLPPQYLNNAVVPGQYIVTLKNETFAELDDEFPDKEKVTASNIPEVNAQVNPFMQHEYIMEKTEILRENVAVYNGTDEQDYPTSPLGEQGAVITDRDIFTYAINGYAVNGVDNPFIFVGNENISTVEQSNYGVPATQYLPIAMNRGDSDKQTSTGCRIDNREGNCNVDLAIIDGKVYPHPDINLFRQFNALDSGWVPGNTQHGMGNAGVCCARDNLAGIVGSAPGARIWNAIFFGSPPGCGPDCATKTDSIDIRALNWVTANAASIEVANWNVQCGSMGGGGNTCPLKSAKEDAVNSVVSAGVTLTTAAGNAHVDIDGWEYCGYSAAICVGAYGDMDGLCGGKSTKTWSYDVRGTIVTGRDDRPAVFSNYGDSVDIAGPGYPSPSVAQARPSNTDVDGTMPIAGINYPYIGNSVQADFQSFGGTSQANPTVSGIAAVIKANNPSFTPAQVRSSLLANAVSVTAACDGSSKGGYVVSVPSQENAPLAYAGNY